MSKKAIVYYSYSNNTRRIVNEIVNVINADVFEIKPKIPFTDDYETLVKQEEKKQGTNEIIEIEELKIKIKEYDIIILGTPVWCNTIASPVRSFLKKYDLEGKTIIPFATNEGELGTTFNDIKKLAKGATIKNELSIIYKNNELKTSLVGITDWIDSI